MPVGLELVLMLILILVAAEVFTNALEHVGEKLGISEGVTGSLFAAVGTALPETLVPLLAIFTGTTAASGHSVHSEIGVGAILGAPLMLSTLSMGLMALSVWRKRGPKGHIRPEQQGLRRDLNTFIMAFVVALAAMFIPDSWKELRFGAAAVLVLMYFFYILATLRASQALVEAGHGTEAEGKMLLCRLGLPHHVLVMVLQLGLGLGLLVYGAKGFIHGVEGASQALGVAPLLLSLLIIPIATELPEKVNSILWIRRGKDTLAVGNISGAMVFQGTLLPAIGISLTPWHGEPLTLVGATITLVSAVWLRWRMSLGQLYVADLVLNLALYFTYLALSLTVLR